MTEPTYTEEQIAQITAAVWKNAHEAEFENETRGSWMGREIGADEVAHITGLHEDLVSEVFCAVYGDLGFRGTSILCNHTTVLEIVSPARFKKAFVDAKTGSAGSAATVKTTTDIVKQTSYTIREAALAHVDITGLVELGKITKRSGAAYKAHVSRRVEVGS